jgi:hypothetical protein
MRRIKVIVAVSTDRWNRPLAEQYAQLKDPDTELTISSGREGCVENMNMRGRQSSSDTGQPSSRPDHGRGRQEPG